MTEVPIQLLHQFVERQHSVKVRFSDSEAVTYRHKGEVLWDGVVHVFEIESGSPAPRVYSWSKVIDKDSGSRRFYAILHAGIVGSPADAVRSILVAENLM